MGNLYFPHNASFVVSNKKGVVIYCPNANLWPFSFYCKIIFCVKSQPSAELIPGKQRPQNFLLVEYFVPNARDDPSACSLEEITQTDSRRFGIRMPRKIRKLSGIRIHRTV